MGPGVFALSFFIFSAQAAVPSGETALRAAPEAKSSLAPLVAYTPTFGVLVGVGYFRKPLQKRGWDLGIYSMASFKPNFLGDGRVDYHFSPSQSWRNELGFSTFLASYYGEGGQTRNADNIRFSKLSLFARSGLQWSEGSWAFWPHVDYRGWHETGAGPSHFAPEDRAVLGATLEYQTPEDSGGVRFHHQATVRLAPAFASSDARSQSFAQAELDLRAFLKPFADITLASRVYFASSVGNPSYSYRYTAGGTVLLRGYFENRFRGKHLAAFQQEVRFPIAGAFSGALFADAGDVSDGVPNRWKLTYGLGARLGLPPDQVAKVRLDIGFSQDQWGAFFLFGETF